MKPVIELTRIAGDPATSSAFLDSLARSRTAFIVKSVVAQNPSTKLSTLQHMQQSRDYRVAMAAGEAIHRRATAYRNRKRPGIRTMTVR